MSKKDAASDSPVLRRDEDVEWLNETRKKLLQENSKLEIFKDKYVKLSAGLMTFAGFVGGIISFWSFYSAETTIKRIIDPILVPIGVGIITALVLLLFMSAMKNSNFAFVIEHEDKTDKKERRLWYAHTVMFSVALGILFSLFISGYIIKGDMKICSSCGERFTIRESSLETNINEPICEDCLVSRITDGEYAVCTHCSRITKRQHLNYGLCENCIHDVRTESDFGICESCGRIIEKSRMELGLCANCIDYAIEDEYGFNFND